MELAVGIVALALIVIGWWPVKRRWDAEDREHEETLRRAARRWSNDADRWQ